MEKQLRKLEATERKVTNERDFYLVIEQKLKNDGYQLLDTLKRISENRTYSNSCLADCF